MSDLVRSCKMENVTFYEVETISGVHEMVQIDHADGSFTSMLKSTYEAMQAEQSTTPVIE